MLQKVYKLQKESTSKIFRPRMPAQPSHLARYECQNCLQPQDSSSDWATSSDWILAIYRDKNISCDKILCQFGQRKKRVEEGRPLAAADFGVVAKCSVQAVLDRGADGASQAEAAAVEVVVGESEDLTIDLHGVSS